MGGLYFYIFFIYLPFLMSCLLGDAEHDRNIVVSAVKPQRLLSVTAEDILA